MFHTQNPNDSVGVKAKSPAGLHNRIRLDLANNFQADLPTEEADDPGADLTIREGNRLAVVEVKTGDPDLPLPSSTLAQMYLLTSRVRAKLAQVGASEILPVLVTNYLVSDADRAELDHAGIKVVPVESPASYNSKSFCQKFARIVGITPENLVRV
jgi:hypothetical protein